MQGKIAGENMTGKDSVFKMMPTYTCRIFEDQFVFLGSSKMGAKDTQMVVRDDLKNGKYVILHTKDGIVKGAVLMNSNDKKMEVMRLISEKTQIDDLPIIQ